MRGLIIFAVLLSAAAGTRVSTYAAQADLLTRFREELNKDSSTTTAATILEDLENEASSSVSSAAVEASSTIGPTTQAPNLEPQITEATVSQLPVDAQDVPNRRYVMYDQRQEGQYNIRADLENFMIVLIPPTPTEGLNLLDLLSKSSYRRNQHSSKSKRKQSPTSQLLSPSGFRNSLKDSTGQNFNYIAHRPASTAANANVSPNGQQRLAEVIEGRTPYHVDISANDEEQSRLHPDRQVDVLPPPYPLAYQHLIKPFHLEAEPTVIQALPPPEMHTHVPANFLESYNQLLTSGLQTAAAADLNARARNNDDFGYYRISRAIRNDNSLHTDDSVAINSLGTQPRYTNFPFYRGNERYPPIDLPEIFLNNKSNNKIRRRLAEQQDAVDVRDQQLDDDSLIPRIIVPPLNSLPQDDIEQDLHDVRLLDLEARTLLSDGMERCAPGHRRDSYGMCREIEGY